MEALSCDVIRPRMTTLPSPSGAEDGPQALQITGLGSNASWLYLNAAVAAVGGLFLIGFSFRHLGAFTYGLYALAATVLGIFTTIDFGLKLLVMRATARDSASFSEDARRQARGDVQAAHSSYAVWGLAVLVVTGAAVVLIATRRDPAEAGKNVPVMVLLVGLSIALNLATSVFAGIPAGRRQFQVPAIGGIAGTAVGIAITVATIGHLQLVSLGAGVLANVLVAQGYCAWWVRVHERWFHLLPRRVAWADIRRVASFAVPLLVLSVAGQVISATDLIVVGAVASAAAVGLYRAGSIVPSQAIILLFTGYDSIFPHLAGTSDLDGQESATTFLTRIASYVAGALFSALIVLRLDVVTAVTGHSSALAESVLVVFCCIWLANVPIHGLSLLLIARGRQNIFVWLMVAEATANIALTIVLAIEIGPIGAAYATLFTIVLSDLVLLPILIRDEFSKGMVRNTVLEGLAAIAAGGATAAIATIPVLWFPPGWVQLSVGLVLGGGFSCAAGLALLRRSGRSSLYLMLRRPARGMTIVGRPVEAPVRWTDSLTITRQPELSLR